jgi:hypothetical protein
MDTSKLVKAEFMPESGSLYPAVTVLRQTCDVLESADRTPDEAARKDLISGAVKMLQNVIDALKPEITESNQDEPNDDD